VKLILGISSSLFLLLNSLRYLDRNLENGEIGSFGEGKEEKKGWN